MLVYDVLLLALSGLPIAQGIFHVPPGELVWKVPPPPGCDFCTEPLQAMLYPPEKFLNFEGGRYIGPGALSFAHGIIPCDKYLVEAGETRYIVCAYEKVVVYEYYLDRLGIRVSLRPTPEALKLVPFITDPAPPQARAIIAFAAALITGLSIVSFFRRHELVVV
ncbi:MAG: hypothetical protein GXO07_04195 [Crenarchaeota archaeon]|nr:hypothetical protein [Thermoproteota archaeon]